MIIYIAKDIEKEQAKKKAILTHEKIEKIKLGEIMYGENGNPLLKDRFISISHTNNVVIVAISDKKIGVDIESKNRICKLKNIDIKTWTQIEAYFKYMQTGIILRELDKEVPIKEYITTIEDFEDYYISICSEDDNIAVVFI